MMLQMETIRTDEFPLKIMAIGFLISKLMRMNI